MNARYSEPNNLAKDVKERIDIVDVIGARLPLDAHHKALCPFHQEKTPSFSVNPIGQYFYCFGCQAGGDVFEFLMRYEGMSFKEAVLELAHEAGILLPRFQRRR